MNINTLIKKWLANDLSPEEKALLDERSVQLMDFIDRETPRFNAAKQTEVVPFDKFEKQLANTPKTTTSWKQSILKIAAIAIVTFGIGYLMMGNPTVTVQTQIAEKETVTLPDNSRVVLNAVSILTYNKEGWDKDRTLQLTGEAFFDVAKGSRFKVSTPDGTITVLGTEFNITQRDHFFEVVCYEGKVSVVNQKINQLLLPGQSIRIIDGNVDQRETRKTMPDWKDNLSSFNSVPFSVVLNELERQYSVKLIFEQIEATQLFTGGFVHENLDKALQSITAPLGLAYEKAGSNQIRIYTP